MIVIDIVFMTVVLMFCVAFALGLAILIKMLWQELMK